MLSDCRIKRPVPRTLFGRIALFLGAVSAVIVVQGCAPAALGSAREKIAAGNFLAARQDLLALAARQSDLSVDQRREVADDLCLTDFMIGKPGVTLAEQRRACVDAMKNPGSKSGDIVASINERTRRALRQEVEAALQARDLAGAERAAIEYQATPGADAELVARWSKQIWSLADAQIVDAGTPTKSSLESAISEARRNHPGVRKLDADAFRRWVRDTSTVSGTPVASHIEVKPSRVELSIDDAHLALAERNLDKLAAVNDGLAARCGCEARTDVAISETGFPAYVIRLDADTQLSEVMILPRGDHAVALPGASDVAEFSVAR